MQKFQMLGHKSSLDILNTYNSGYILINICPPQPNMIICNLKMYRDFPGGTVVRTLHSQRRGLGFDLWSGN